MMTRPIRRLLVANRGEIAVRIQRTAQRMGITTIAIYSEVDRYAPHVEMAHERYFLGGNTPAETYLHIEKILAIAREARADAIHPGYGFCRRIRLLRRRLRKRG
jgi:acetyl/propionyl-CoA carboxylase alpha subunit